MKLVLVHGLCMFSKWLWWNPFFWKQLTLQAIVRLDLVRQTNLPVLQEPVLIETAKAISSCTPSKAPHLEFVWKTRESRIDSRRIENDAPQDIFQIFWTKLSPPSTLLLSEVATSSSNEVIGEAGVSLPAIHIHTNGARLKMDNALSQFFAQRFS